MIDLVRKGLSLRFTNQAAALVCGSSADVRPMSLLFTAWGQRRGPPPPQLRRGRRGRWSGWSEKTFVSLDFPLALHAKLWYIIQAETHAGVVQWQNVSFPS